MLEENSVPQYQKGVFFSKKKYMDVPNISFSEAQELLPNPFCEKHPDYIECYWYTWQLAYQNAYVPSLESGYVSNFVDAAFNDCIFMWDTAFITMFCNIGHPYIPGIRSLDNFYCKQFDDGEIPRELVRATGGDFNHWVNHDRKPLHSFYHNHYQHRGLQTAKTPDYEEMFKPKLGRNVEHPPYLTLDNLNHPILAWAELESYRQTGDISRIEMVWDPLLKYYEALIYHLYNQFGLFVTDWASMDNSPRNPYLGSGVDISCEMALFSNNLIEMAKLLKAKYDSEGNFELSHKFNVHSQKLTEKAKSFSNDINRYMWDDAAGFYYDVTDSGERSPIKTIASFWALLAQVADQEQASRLVGWLNDPSAFARAHRVPTLAADEQDFCPDGGYWRGAVWAPTNTMVIRGLEKYGYKELARDIALNHLQNVVAVYKQTGTIWENYAPDRIKEGDKNRRDFVGWSGIAPILYFMEYLIGLRGDASKNKLVWNVDTSLGETGCSRYWFAGRTLNLRAIPQLDGSVHIQVESDGPILLEVNVGSRKQTMELTDTCEFVL